ncbi:MAG TPA: hypothetical protein VHC21_02740 [Candidatus Saccharimonadales bacterium]|nr:hypothetical protein [Candidatus Saccharimonadales bacterium]
MANPEHEYTGLAADGGAFVLESLRPEDCPLPALGDASELREAALRGTSLLAATEAALRRKFQQEVQQKASDA